MASSVTPINASLAAQLQLLKRQAATATGQLLAAEKAMASFAEHLKKNPTGENAKHYQELVAEAMEANEHLAALHRKVNKAERARLKQGIPTAPQAGCTPLSSRAVDELDIEGPVGYYPTQE